MHYTHCNIEIEGEPCARSEAFCCERCYRAERETAYLDAVGVLVRAHTDRLAGL